MASRTIPVPQPVDQDPMAAIIDPSSASIALMRAQAQRDLGMISGKELAVMEAAAKAGGVGRSVTLMNPFTGKIRKAII